MTDRRKVTVVAGFALIASLALSVFTLQKIDVIREGSTLQDVLYIPSANTVKRLSLGYTGLMADLYWTRAVQYFGGKHKAKSQEYKLLQPLLEITTTLDPHLLVAYQFGSVFLAQKPPQGAGDPNAAAELVKKGIALNPDAWRLYYDLGFIQWQELGDRKAAAETFLKGSQVPGAHPWMKVMSANLASETGDKQLAKYLWENIYQETQDKMIKENAANHLRGIRADEEITFLQNYVERFKEQMGHAPESFQEMLSDGWLKRQPLDPLGYPYIIRDGRVVFSHPEEFPFATKGMWY